MWRFIADLSVVISTESRRAEKKIKNVPHSAKSISIIDMMETRTILKEQFQNNYPKLKNNEPRPKFTDSYKISVYLEYFRSYFLLLLFLWVLLKIRTA